MAVRVLPATPATPTPPTPEVAEATTRQRKPVLTELSLSIINSYRPYPELKTDKDLFLKPNGGIIEVDPKCYRDRQDLKGVLKECPDALPLIWAEWLIGPEDGPGTLTLGEATIIIATGLKGGGKSLTLAHIGAKALMMGMPVWSNMNIKFYLVNGGEVTLCESKPLDWGAFLTLSQDLKHGAIIIDELTYFLSSRQSQSVRNRIINAGINQVRKRTLDFYASVKFLRQADVNLREEMDAEMFCNDYAKTGAGQSQGLPEGCFFEWWVRDISGWSGQPSKHINIPGDAESDRLGDPIYKDNGIHREFDGRYAWPIFDSYEVIDASDAFRKVKLDLEDLVVTDKQDGPAVDETIQGIVDEFRHKGYVRVTTAEMQQAVKAAGMKMAPSTLGAKLGSGCGIKRYREGNTNYYLLTE